jgi:hypothetical protein
MNMTNGQGKYLMPNANNSQAAFTGLRAIHYKNNSCLRSWYLR